MWHLLAGTGGIMKKLEEMNLVDDFLAYSLTVHKTYGEEACRYILQCILQRRIRHLTVMPQKTWYGEGPGKHGVHLDICLDEEDGEIFDMEPDRNSGLGDAGALPRRARFYHAKIDAGALAAGEGYGKLRNVIVIFITTYDPFGRNRMVYTVRNGCVEAPDLPYEDGARTIFLYTKGSEGDPPEDLCLLVRYMEQSTAENARSEGLVRLHKMVSEVKADREVGLAYMKNVEIEQMIRAEGRAEAILMLLEEKGPVSARVQQAVQSQKDMDVLNAWLLLAARVEDAVQFEERAGL